MLGFGSQSLPDAHSQSAVAVRFSPDGRFLASAGADKSCHIYDLSSNTLVHSFSEEHQAGLNDCCWFDEKHIVTAADDGCVRVFDLEANKLILTHRVPKAAPFSLAVNRSNAVLSAGDTDGSVYSYAFSVKDAVQRIHAHAATISSLSHSADGEELFTASFDGILRQWIPRQSALCIRSILPSPKAPVPIGSVSYSPNQRYVLASVLDGSHRLYHRDFRALPAAREQEVLSQATHIKEFRGHVNEKFSAPSKMIKVHSDHFSVLSGSEDGRLCVWNANTQALERESVVYEGAAVMGADVAERDDGSLIIACSSSSGQVSLHTLTNNNDKQSESAICDTIQSVGMEVE